MPLFYYFKNRSLMIGNIVGIIANILIAIIAGSVIKNYYVYTKVNNGNSISNSEIINNYEKEKLILNKKLFYVKEYYKR